MCVHAVLTRSPLSEAGSALAVMTIKASMHQLITFQLDIALLTQRLPCLDIPLFNLLPS